MRIRQSGRAFACAFVPKNYLGRECWALIGLLKPESIVFVACSDVGTRGNRATFDGEMDLGKPDVDAAGAAGRHHCRG